MRKTILLSLLIIAGCSGCNDPQEIVAKHDGYNKYFYCTYASEGFCPGYAIVSDWLKPIEWNDRVVGQKYWDWTGSYVVVAKRSFDGGLNDYLNVLKFVLVVKNVKTGSHKFVRVNPDYYNRAKVGQFLEANNEIR